MIEQWNAVVSCDFCGNTEEFEFHGDRPPPDRGIEAMLKKEGWMAEGGGEWRCPDCVADDEPEGDDE